MKTYFGSSQADSSYAPATVVAIGNFDGVHLGHQELLKVARSVGQELGLPLTVYTFNPHPTLELRPEIPLRLLMTYPEKRNQLSLLGVDFCIEEPFDFAFAQTTARDFFFEILLRRLHAKALVVGADFAFGKKREGNLELLKKWCLENQIRLEVVSPCLKDGKWVSSSRIRDALQAGNLQEASELLGRPFFYRGEVVHGDKRGRTIGFPTANMACAQKFPLPNGVYATSVIWRDMEYLSVTNIGTRPTFQSGEATQWIPIRIETHILDQNFDLYGETLEVRFFDRIRDEKRFADVHELKAQIQSDVILARDLLRSRNF
jgi:riboflavin kinase/FMN adenylyltransferase